MRPPNAHRGSTTAGKPAWRQATSQRGWMRLANAECGKESHISSRILKKTGRIPVERRTEPLNLHQTVVTRDARVRYSFMTLHPDQLRLCLQTDVCQLWAWGGQQMAKYSISINNLYPKYMKRVYVCQLLSPYNVGKHTFLEQCFYT